jgi:hypothetical protein
MLDETPAARPGGVRVIGLCGTRHLRNKEQDRSLQLPLYTLCRSVTSSYAPCLARPAIRPPVRPPVRPCASPTEPVRPFTWPSARPSDRLPARPFVSTSCSPSASPLVRPPGRPSARPPGRAPTTWSCRPSSACPFPRPPGPPPPSLMVSFPVGASRRQTEVSHWLSVACTLGPGNFQISPMVLAGVRAAVFIAGWRPRSEQKPLSDGSQTTQPTAFNPLGAGLWSGQHNRRNHLRHFRYFNATKQ